MKKLSGRHVQALVVMFLFGSSLVTGGATSAKQDSWLCMCLGFLLVIPMLWLHTAILELYPGRDYFQNILRACGNPVGKIIISLLSIYFLYVGALVVRVFAEFLHSSSMAESPLVLLSASLLFCVVLCMKKGLYVSARVSKFMLPFALLTLYMTIVLSVKDINWNNLKPVLHSGIKPIAQGTLLLFTLPFGEILAIGPVIKHMSEKEKIFPNLLKGLLIAFPLLLLANLRNTLVLGYSSTIFAFSSYECVSVIALGDFFTRTEVLIGTDLLVAGFFKVCVMIYAGCDGAVKVFNLGDYVPMVAPCSVLVLWFSIIAHQNTEELFRLLKYLPFYSLLFQLILPASVLIVGKVKTKKQKKGPNEKRASEKRSPKKKGTADRHPI